MARSLPLRVGDDGPGVDGGTGAGTRARYDSRAVGLLGSGSASGTGGDREVPIYKQSFCTRRETRVDVLACKTAALEEIRGDCDRPIHQLVRPPLGDR